VVFLDFLRKLLPKLHTQPDLQTILMTGIKGALQDDPLFDMPTCNREPSFEILVSSQNDIGWSHLLRGRFSRQCVLLQQAHLDQDADCSSLLTGERWLQKVLHPLWTHLCSAWKLRNPDLHGIDKADQELKRKAKLHPAIVALCTAAAQLTYLDKRIFDLPLDTRLDKTTSSDQAAWINLHAPTVRIAKTSAADKLLTTKRDIRSFFVRVPAEHGDQGEPPRSRSPAEQGDEPQPIPRLRDGQIPPPCRTALISSHSIDRIVTLLAMPPTFPGSWCGGSAITLEIDLCYYYPCRRILDGA
jgi:hypothetical protein